MGNLCDSGTKPDEIHEVDAQAAATKEMPEQVAAPAEDEAKAAQPEAAPAETPAEAAPEPPPASEPTPAAATPAAPAGPAADGSFTVTVVKADGKTLKTGIKSADGKAVVNSIAPDGIIAEFNAANPAAAIMSGDIIESVNGTTGDATAITDAIKAGSTLTIVLKRPVFTIELVKEDGKSLGVGFKPDGAAMGVTSISPDGLMAAYNKANPGTALKVGDAILEANGNSKVVDGIKGTAAGAKVVLKVKRG